MILVAFLLNLNATSICKTAQKVIKNKEKPQKFITSGAFYMVTRTGFEPAFGVFRSSDFHEKDELIHVFHMKKVTEFRLLHFLLHFPVALFQQTRDIESVFCDSEPMRVS